MHNPMTNGKNTRIDADTVKPVDNDIHCPGMIPDFDDLILRRTGRAGNAKSWRNANAVDLSARQRLWLRIIGEKRKFDR